eukprot:2095906-Rhodomonas_salina.6
MHPPGTLPFAKLGDSLEVIVHEVRALNGKIKQARFDSHHHHCHCHHYHLDNNISNNICGNHDNDINDDDRAGPVDPDAASAGHSGAVARQCVADARGCGGQDSRCSPLSHSSLFLSLSLSVSLSLSLSLSLSFPDIALDSGPSSASSLSSSLSSLSSLSPLSSSLASLSSLSSSSCRAVKEASRRVQTASALKALVVGAMQTLALDTARAATGTASPSIVVQAGSIQTRSEPRHRTSSTRQDGGDSGRNASDSEQLRSIKGAVNPIVRGGGDSQQ